jgi:putative transposase
LQGTALQTNMPAKNRIKEFFANSYWHLYNRGVEKRLIFLDDQDYNVFNSYLETYLVPKDMDHLNNLLNNGNPTEKDTARKLLRLNNFSDEISLLAYCLMPNHFHFLIYQNTSEAIDKFSNSLFTRYAMYFNRKYKRVGRLFQDLYKAVSVHSREQLLWLSRYIHRNPIDLLQGSALQSYKYSSYPEYIGIRNKSWIKPNEILTYFKSQYSAFVEISNSEPESIYPLLLSD